MVIRGSEEADHVRREAGVGKVRGSGVSGKEGVSRGMV